MTRLGHLRLGLLGNATATVPGHRRRRRGPERDLARTRPPHRQLWPQPHRRTTRRRRGRLRRGHASAILATIRQKRKNVPGDVGDDATHDRRPGGAHRGLKLPMSSWCGKAVTPASQVEKLTRWGYRCFYSETARLTEVASTTRRLGKLAGTRTRRRPQRRRLRNRTRPAANRRCRQEAPEGVLPDMDRPLMTVGRAQIIDDALVLCGERQHLRRPRPARARRRSRGGAGAQPRW